MSKEQEQVVELDAQAIEAIAKQMPKTEIDYDKLAEKVAAKSAPAAKEDSKLKSAKKPVEGEVVGKFDKLDKYDFAAAQFKAWVDGDQKTLKELNEAAIKSFEGAKIDKATYMNVGTTADGGAIVPNRELMTDIFTTLGNYSQVAADLRTVTLTEGSGIDYASLVQDVVITEVGTEGGNKPMTKLVFAKGNLDTRELAGIAVITKKLIRQAAMSVYDLLRDSFARAIAAKRAELALTDTTSGIVNKAGVNVVTTATGNTTVDKVTWADLKRMRHETPAAARQGGKYYISAALLEELDTKVDSQGRDLELVKMDESGTSGTFKDGSRFAVEDGLGEGGAPHAVYGAMGRFGILLREGTVENDTFDTGTVTDGSSVVHNLLQQNKVANRVAFYENVGFPVENAFTILELAA